MGTVVTVLWDFVAPQLPPIVGARDAIFPALAASLMCLVVVSLDGQERMVLLGDGRLLDWIPDPNAAKPATAPTVKTPEPVL